MEKLVSKQVYITNGDVKVLQQAVDTLIENNLCHYLVQDLQAIIDDFSNEDEEQQ